MPPKLRNTMEADALVKTIMVAYTIISVSQATRICQPLSKCFREVMHNLLISIAGNPRPSCKHYR